MSSDSVRFFDAQFERQVRDADYALNPFEQLALPYVAGSVLDLGCGLGNLSIAAAKLGHAVTALDASPTAIDRIVSEASRLGLPIDARRVDFATTSIAGDYDTIVSIGLLMFLPRSRALALLDEIRHHVRPGGRAAVNVLVEGTTFMDVFDPGHYYLFAPDELTRAFQGWDVLVNQRDEFRAPRDTMKSFSTVIAKKRGVSA